MNETGKGNELVIVDTAPVSAQSLTKQVAAIQEAMRSVMKEGTHFGVIPGCGDKPTLLKAGAEKISLMFRLLSSFDVQRVDLPQGHREYSVLCSLRDMNGHVIGQGVGICSTMESKYRYRGNSFELTEHAVPKEYWDSKNPEVLSRIVSGYAANQLTAKKNDKGQWVIAIKGEKQEHPDIADTYNTVLKIAKKRSHVDAVLTSTAASDIFTQDIEEMQDIAKEPAVVVVAEPIKSQPTTPASVKLTPADQLQPKAKPQIAQGAVYQPFDTQPCKKCGKSIAWITTSKGKKQAIDPDLYDARGFDSDQFWLTKDYDWKKGRVDGQQGYLPHPKDCDAAPITAPVHETSFDMDDDSGIPF